MRLRILLVLLVLALLGLVLLMYYVETPLAISIRARLQPSPDMPRQILGHKYVKKNVLDEKNFKGTRGCLCIFRDRDVETVFEDPLLAPLFPHFQELCAAGEMYGNAKRSNAFVMNILVNYASGAGVGWHIDDTIESALPDSDYVERIATAVSVLYVSTGGQKSCGGIFKIKDDKGQTTKIVPRTGDIVVFPGRFDHKVSPLSPGMPPRISLVVESYALDRADYEALEIQVPS